MFFCLEDKNAQEEKQILEQRLIALVPPGCEENPPADCWWKCQKTSSHPLLLLSVSLRPLALAAEEFLLNSPAIRVHCPLITSQLYF